MNAPSIRNIVFSLSKPFGVYYDRIGGVFSREEDPGLFGNKWFKNLTSLAIGCELLRRHDVFDMSNRYGQLQGRVCEQVCADLDIRVTPSDVYMLAHGDGHEGDSLSELNDYLRRGDGIRVCLTPGMYRELNDVE